MSAPTTPEDRYALAGEYVLGTLGASERRSVEARLPHDPELAQAVRQWESRLLPLSALAEPRSPSAGLWSRIQTSVQGAAARPAHARSRWDMAGWWNSLPLWRGLALTGVAAAVALGTVLRVQPPAEPPRFMVVLVAPQDRAPGWVVESSHGGHVRLIPLGTTPVPSGKALQFWTKADGWQGPVSLGLVKPGEYTRVALDQLPALQANQLFELTLEPATGSPTGKPTGPIQFIGRAVAVGEMPRPPASPNL